MPKKRAKTDGIRFKRFEEEQRVAFSRMLQLPGLRDTFEELARDGHRREGRGLVVWLSPDGTVGGFKPPVFIAAAEWRRNPLLVNTPHPDLLQALITYDTATSYIVLIAGTTSAYQGRYTWWVEPFAKKRAIEFG